MGDEGKGPRYRTQRRWIERCGLWLGLAAVQSQRLAQAVARSLGLAGLDHTEARQQFARAGGLQGRGRVVVTALEALALDATLWSRLLAAGYLSGLWGRPYLWEPATGQRILPVAATPPSSPGRDPP